MLANPQTFEPVSGFPNWLTGEALMLTRRRLNDDAEEALNYLCAKFRREYIAIPEFRSIERFVDRLGKEQVIAAIDIAHEKHPRNFLKGFPYFCGVCWASIRRGERLGYGEQQ